MTIELCKVCFSRWKGSHCPQCGNKELAPKVENPQEIGLYKLSQLLTEAYGGHIYSCEKNGKGFIIWLSDVVSEKIEITEESSGFLPIDSGMEDGVPWLVYEIPDRTITGKSQDASEIWPQFKQMLPELESRFLSGLEPQPWEIVFTGGLWKIWGGWENPGRARLSHRKTPYTPPEKYLGKAPDKKSLTYFYSAIIYNAITGNLPVGLLKPPSGARENLTNLDYIILSNLNQDAQKRMNPDDFVSNMEKHYGERQTVSKLLSALTAVSGAAIIAALGYGLTVIMSHVI